ncbi:alpha/beta hydrolase [Paenibacillus sp. S150]|uniref:alpha/beta hydrolase n=1 Tax=Paenibacillus sp. S150 TaxID=2749826 RepID=UPI001C59C079|nr:alpha/beta hydrolase [Paenibacillus sp. S150]MBW4081983.1 alpha/beta hydrolase [Paenibacillus sp. S150]
MRKISEEKVYSREQLQKKVRLIKWLAAHSTKAGRIGKKRNGKELFLDTVEGKIRVLAYNMEGSENLPLFINIHGGGFILGRAEMDDPYLMNVADKAKVKILSIDYSLSPEEIFPKALNECYAVVKYAKEHARELGIDPDRIALGGHSAGGNLSAAVCLKNMEAKELDIKCLILDYPPLDIYTDPYLKPQPKGALAPGMCRIFNACYCNGKEERKNPLVSPVFATADQVKSFPPTLILTASRDSLYKEAEDFRDKLAEAGVVVTHKRFEGSLHGFTLSDKPDAVKGWQMMIDHLNRYLH